jgi:phenylpropionate dioxygenase-like ring-hydroxylating dioxygenase large terminal subunit
MTFLKNAWYAAAWISELASKPFARRIAGEPIVIYRSESGRLVALRDRCPHRFAPLSRGKIAGENIACGYHGLTFGPSGICVYNPFSDVIPAKAKVPTYPIVERHTLIWVWLGRPELANPELIPDLSVFTRPKTWRAAFGYMQVAVNTEILVDNLLDLSHAEYLHPGNLGPGNLAAGKFTFKAVGDAVEFELASANTTAPPMFDVILPSNEKAVDFVVTGRWDPPGIVQLQSTTTYVASPKEQHVTFKGVHIVVPETSVSSHYFYAGIRNLRLDDEVLSTAIEQGLSDAFTNEDKPMVEAVQSRMESLDLLMLDPVLLPMDGAAIRVRRRLKRMIADEQALASSTDTIRSTTAG